MKPEHIGPPLKAGQIHAFHGGGGGKSSLALHAIASAQKQGGTAAFIDSEHNLDLEMAARLGVDISRLLVAQPDGPEDALQVTEALVRSKAVDILVVGPLGTPQNEDGLVGTKSRLMSETLRRITSQPNDCTLIFLTAEPNRCSALQFYAATRVFPTDEALAVDVKIPKKEP